MGEEYAGLDLGFLPEATELDRLLDDARTFVREHKGKGKIIDARILLAVLLQDQGVKDFIASRTGRSAQMMERVAQAAEENAIHRIDRVNKDNAPQTFRFTETGEDGSPETRTIKFSKIPSGQPSDEIGIDPNWVDFKGFELGNTDRLCTRLEILVALIPDARTGCGDFSVEWALKKVDLLDFQKDILKIEYGGSGTWYRTLESPTGKALDLVRRWQEGEKSPAVEQKPGKTGVAARAMDRATEPAAQVEPAGKEDPGNNKITIAQIAAALQDPQTVDALLANPAARDALMAGITRALTRVPAPSQTLDASGQEAEEAGNRQPPGDALPPPANTL